MLHDLADRLRAGQTLIGTWLYLNDVGVAEIVAGVGFDFMMIDMEHSPTGFDNLRSLLMAIEHHCAPMVRVKANSPEFISAILDLGPAGIMVPRVNTAEQARLAVKNAKFHPLGLRGFGPYRVSDYTRNLAEVLSRANDKQMLWIQIEHRDAVSNIEQITEVEGIDALFVGMGDLSQSLGHLGGMAHPETLEKIRRVVDVARRCGLPIGSAFGTDTNLCEWHKAGMRIFTVAADFRFVVNGAHKALARAKAALGLRNA